MPPFTPSTMTLAVAKTVVAESAGAQASTEMLTRAGRSLDATAQRWNRLRLKYLLSEQFISLVAPISVTGCSMTSGSVTASSTSSFTSAGVSADDTVSGGAARPESFLSSTINATAIALSAPATATFSDTTLTFTRSMYALATDFNHVYDVRMVSNNRPLFYVQRRTYDRLIMDQVSTASIWGYELFSYGEKGKVRFVYPVGGVGTVLMRYYRRITMPTANTSATTLDLPQDYEDAFIAASKAHFLADKDDSAPKQRYWDAYAQTALKQILGDQHDIPDEELAFLPPPPRYAYDIQRMPPVEWDAP